MSVLITSDSASDPFSATLVQAGAVFASHRGRSVAVNFGSAAGELAVCMRAVGLVDSSGLTKLALEAPPAQLSHLVARFAGTTVAVGGALRVGGAWWCKPAPNRALVLCDATTGGRMLGRLRTQATHHVALTVRDHSDDWAAISLIGRSTPSVLQALGAYGPAGDARQASPVSAGTIQGVEVSWLLESDRRALALAPREHAGTVWRAIEDAGRPFGISCVGLDAASRYSLLERAGQFSARTPA